MYRSQIDQVRSFSKKFYDTAEKAHSRIQKKQGNVADSARKVIVEGIDAEALGGDRDAFMAQFAQEAIILAELRPAYYVRDDGIDMNNDIEGDEALVGLINANKAILDGTCHSVGRVDLLHHWSLHYGGTGFLIDEDLAVTNRHVAHLFGEAIWNGFRFRTGRFGQEMEARLDYKHLHESNSRQRAEVEEIIYIASDQEPDFALLRVRKRDEIEPLFIDPITAQSGHPVAVIGYPAEDGDRNDPELMDDLFGGVYEVKRFAPGFITERDDAMVVLTSDYTSLGGNSGSPVCSLDTGKVIGLHFAGRFRENNYAVSGEILAAAARSTRIIVDVPALAEEAPTTSAEDLAGRNGYDPEFLGGGDLRVNLPILGAWASEVAPVADNADGVLSYQNFSVVQSAARRLPLVTAVNIDGENAKRLRRKGSWRLDGRLSHEHQVGNELYKRNPLDRGHMVRRRDPGWGDSAQQAEIDTFHYTNAVPQHEDLNQRDWVGLEDYILEAAETRDFKVSVFTGPIFRDSDKRLKAQPGAEDIQIPEEFWKVAVIINEATGALSATGYVLSHGRFIRDMVESPFVYGQYKTYQVKIAKIETETGLIFGRLVQFDPLGADLEAEAPFSQVARTLDGPESLVLSKPAASRQRQ